jgi:hypothetical protein
VDGAGDIQVDEVQLIGQRVLPGEVTADADASVDRYAMRSSSAATTRS